jgi:hypothetical protein
VINVICLLRRGGKVGYDSAWVEKLQRGVARNLSVPHRFICFSDCDVPCERIPLLDGDHGFWSKMQLFRPNILPPGANLYIDLDTVICGNLDDIYYSIHSQPFVMWIEADKNIHSSAFMFWQHDCSHLWNLYQSHPLSYWESLYGVPPLYGDQAIISENTAHTVLTDHCPTSWFHIASHKDARRDLSQIKMLMFRKTSQKPSTMGYNPLVQQHWI